MATKNFFDLLGDDENEDPSQVVVRANSVYVEVKLAVDSVKKPAAPAKLPSKPASSAEADVLVKESQRAQYDGVRGGRGGGRGRRGGRGYYGDSDGPPREGGDNRERKYDIDRSVGQTRDVDGFVGARNSFVEKPIRVENGEGRSYEGSRGGGRGRGRGGRGYGDGEERPRRREFDRHSGNARGNEAEKRAGAGRGNWGTEVDSTLVQEIVEAGKDEENRTLEVALKPEQEASADVSIEKGDAGQEEEEDNEMTLEEYEKVLEAKRQALEADKASERKVEVDKAFAKMHLMDNKKREEDIFVKLGQGKEKAKKEVAEREEKSRKHVSINDFLKPAEGEKYYGPLSNRGRGVRSGRGERREGGDRREGGGRDVRDSNRGGFGGGRFGGSRGQTGGTSAPKIEDQVQFPTLGGK